MCTLLVISMHPNRETGWKTFEKNYLEISEIITFFFDQKLSFQRWKGLSKRFIQKYYFSCQPLSFSIWNKLVFSSYSLNLKMHIHLNIITIIYVGKLLLDCYHFIKLSAFSSLQNLQLDKHWVFTNILQVK